MPGAHVAIVGGSVSGLAAALGLAKRGVRVTLLEADATPLPASPLEAFESWERRGAPQVRHSHAFLARLRNLLRDRHPELLTSLLQHGADELAFSEIARRLFPDAPLAPGDEDIVLLACRRITFEWVLRQRVLATEAADLRDGCRVVGLVAHADAGGPPHVTGVRLLDRGREASLAADFVIDASGRRSKLGHWLREIGAEPMREESEPCGIFYASRFYRLRDGAEPPVNDGAIGADLGYLKYGIFQADDRIFSITLAASPDDPDLRALLRETAFERATAALPAVATWTEPARSEPISKVHGMGNLRNTRRHFVADGEPLALGVFPIGDALVHTNPINGRGCTLAWWSAELFVDAFASHHPRDPRALARELHGEIETRIIPWYIAGLQQDRDAIAVEAMQRRGHDPYRVQREDGAVDPRAFMRALVREGLVPGLREDPILLRAFMRVFNLLDAPTDLMKDPELLQRVLAAYQRRGDREPGDLGPGRQELIERLGSARAA